MSKVKEKASSGNILRVCAVVSFHLRFGASYSVFFFFFFSILGTVLSCISWVIHGFVLGDASRMTFLNFSLPSVRVDTQIV